MPESTTCIEADSVDYTMTLIHIELYDSYIIYKSYLYNI